ncbi:unnamed protein product, partial [Symbiodinium necroappetens]
ASSAAVSSWRARDTSLGPAELPLRTTGAPRRGVATSSLQECRPLAALERSGLGEEFVQLVLWASPSSAAGRTPGAEAPCHSSVESRKRPDDAVSKIVVEMVQGECGIASNEGKRRAYSYASDWRAAAASVRAPRWRAVLPVFVQQAVTSTALGSAWPPPPHASQSQGKCHHPSGGLQALGQRRATTMAKRCSTRAVIQIFLTGMCLATAITAFTFAFVFEQFMDQMTENYRGDLRSENLPCIRSTLDLCPNAITDKCWDRCCPPGYFCSRSPIVGLYCQHGLTSCEDFNWCRDFADIPRTCATSVCKTNQMVTRVTSWSYILAAIGIFLDLVDIITIFTLPDAVVFKAATNVFSSLVKWLAFGLVVGAGTQGFMAELEMGRCFNGGGMQLVADAGGLFVSYAIVQVVSATLSLVLAPFSAYFGGKLQGGEVPYVK